MSSCMTSNETLSMLADVIVHQSRVSGDTLIPKMLEYEFRGLFNEKEVFKRLANLNVEALKQRYPKNYNDMIGEIEYVDGCDIWQPEEYDSRYGIVYIRPWFYQFVKSLGFYLYQCNEGDCYKSKLYTALFDLLRNSYSHIILNSPGYTRAEWR